MSIAESRYLSSIPDRLFRFQMIVHHIEISGMQCTMILETPGFCVRHGGTHGKSECRVGRASSLPVDHFVAPVGGYAQIIANL